MHRFKTLLGRSIKKFNQLPAELKWKNLKSETPWKRIIEESEKNLNLSPEGYRHQYPVEVINGTRCVLTISHDLWLRDVKETAQVRIEWVDVTSIVILGHKTFRVITTKWAFLFRFETRQDHSEALLRILSRDYLQCSWSNKNTITVGTLCVEGPPPAYDCGFYEFHAMLVLMDILDIDFDEEY